MTSVDDPGPYGLASGIAVDDRRPSRRRVCPDCGRALTGGPAVFWCARGHTIHGGALEAAEERVARAAAVRAHELELERARHVPEHRAGVAQ